MRRLQDEINTLTKKNCGEQCYIPVFSLRPDD
jgi:hypothetical protein